MQHTPLSPLQLHPLPAPSPSLPFPHKNSLYFYIFVMVVIGRGHRAQGAAPSSAVPVRHRRQPGGFFFSPLQDSNSCLVTLVVPVRHLQGTLTAALGQLRLPAAGAPMLHQPPFKHVTMCDDDGDDDDDGRPWECISKDMDHPVRHWHWHWQCSHCSGLSHWDARVPLAGLGPWLLCRQQSCALASFPVAR